MDFALTPEQELIRDSVGRLSAAFGLEYWSKKDQEHAFIDEYWDALADAGWLGITIPEDHGGGGLGLVEAAIVIEEAALSGAGATVAQFFMFAYLQAATVARHGTDEQKERFLPGLATGGLLCAIALTEPDAGSNSLEISTKGSRRGDVYVLNGQKVWISGLERADRILVAARTSGVDEVAKRSQGMSLFLVDSNSKGIESQLLPKLGTNAMSSRALFLNDVEVPAVDRIGPEGAGWQVLVDTLNVERIVTTAGALGAGELAIELATAYARERVVFGRPIGANQGIQYPLAHAKAELAAARVLNFKAAWQFDSGEESAAAGNMAKLIATEAAFAACDAAMQTHGGYGYSTEYHVGRLWRDSRLFRIAPVTQEMVLNYIAQHVLGLPRS